MEPIASKHARLFNRWIELCPGGSWQLNNAPDVPRAFRGGTVAYRELSFVDSQIKGLVGYCLRVTEEARASDTLEIDFDPASVDYPFLVHTLIPMIIETFSPHEITLGDDEFRKPVIHPGGVAYVGDPRACGGFLEPVFFMDAERIKTTFGLELETFVEKMTPKVEKVVLIGGGALVIGSSAVLPFEEGLALTRSMESAVEKESLFSRVQRLLGWRGGRSV
jgi:hypothetical protein